MYRHLSTCVYWKVWNSMYKLCCQTYVLNYYCIDSKFVSFFGKIKCIFKFIFFY